MARNQSMAFMRQQPVKLVVMYDNDKMFHAEKVMNIEVSDTHFMYTVAKVEPFGESLHTYRIPNKSLVGYAIKHNDGMDVTTLVREYRNRRASRMLLSLAKR